MTDDESPTGEKPPESGLRNPTAAVRAVGAGALVAEALVLLLAILPIRVLGGDLTGPAVVFVIVLSVLCVVLAGLLKRRWAWTVGSAIQVALLASGLVFPAWLTALGVVFGLVWIYVLHVRRSVLGGRPGR
jgi:Protein of unknown function (DUF4233)